MPLPLDNFRSPAALLRFFGVAGIGLALDLWTKALAETHLQNATIRFIPGLLHFVYTTNKGAVFGLGQGLWPLFLVVSLLAIGFLSSLFAYSDRQRFYQVILGLLLAGVLGNMYDRIMFQHVRDMIHALPDWYWPDWIISLLPSSWQTPGPKPLFPWIFNLADTFLCVGVFFMIVYSIVARPNHPPAPEPAGE